MTLSEASSMEIAATKQVICNRENGQGVNGWSEPEYQFI